MPLAGYHCTTRKSKIEDTLPDLSICKFSWLSNQCTVTLMTIPVTIIIRTWIVADTFVRSRCSHRQRHNCSVTNLNFCSFSQNYFCILLRVLILALYSSRYDPLVCLLNRPINSFSIHHSFIHQRTVFKSSTDII